MKFNSSFSDLDFFISNSPNLLSLNYSIQFQKIINLPSLDVDEFLQTHLLMQQNSTTILASQNFENAVVFASIDDQPKLNVCINFEASDLLSGRGGCFRTGQSDDLFQTKKQLRKER